MGIGRPVRGELRACADLYKIAAQRARASTRSSLHAAVTRRTQVGLYENFDGTGRGPNGRVFPGTHLNSRAGRFFCVSSSLLTAAVLLANGAAAQVAEPNGISVPRILTNGEVTLAQYFTSQSETIDPVGGASATPGVFSPLCGFRAALVLSQSGAQAGISWYNVPPSATAAPAAIYTLVPEGTAIGVIVESANIRNSANYAGGLIGFVLTKGGSRVYYSEYQRNALCSNCLNPGYWKMALAYPSTQTPDTYYLAFEDWEGANVNDWGQNDGDFNDKVFRITGVRCPGGGKPCDTMKPGICAQGLTECQSADMVVCKQVVPESTEVCDGLDNDCNGSVDEGDHICPDNKVCLRGVCVPACSHGEFTCSGGTICVGGVCVDPRCADVVCEQGRVCREGRCVGACDDVVCPGNQVCVVGRCVDPCAGVTCSGGRVCQSGVCIEACSCVGCSAGLTCDIRSGLCVSPGCEGQSCDGGVCRGGSCVDPCTSASCPRGGACVAGECQEPDGTVVFDGGPPPVIIIGPTGGAAGMSPRGSGAGGSSEGGAGPASQGGTNSAGPRRDAPSSGCGCRLGNAQRRGRWFDMATLALAAALWQRRTLQRRRRAAR